jgi:hypothetical protein
VDQKELAKSRRTLPSRPALKTRGNTGERPRQGVPRRWARCGGARCGCSPIVADGPSAHFADARRASSRAYGLKSWPRLVRHLTLSPEARRLHVLDVLFQELPDVRDQKLASLAVNRRFDSEGEPIWNNTALEAAKYGGHRPILVLLKPLFKTPRERRTVASLGFPSVTRWS